MTCVVTLQHLLHSTGYKRKVFGHQRTHQSHCGKLCYTNNFLCKVRQLERQVSAKPQNKISYRSVKPHALLLVLTSLFLDVLRKLFCHPLYRTDRVKLCSSLLEISLSPRILQLLYQVSGFERLIIFYVFY